jgi:sirohydrochlorin ferrochelatase
MDFPRSRLASDDLREAITAELANMPGVTVDRHGLASFQYPFDIEGFCARVAHRTGADQTVIVPELTAEAVAAMFGSGATRRQ